MSKLTHKYNPKHGPALALHDCSSARILSNPWAQGLLYSLLGVHDGDIPEGLVGQGLEPQPPRDVHHLVVASEDHLGLGLGLGLALGVGGRDTYRRRLPFGFKLRRRFGIAAGVEPKGGAKVTLGFEGFRPQSELVGLKCPGGLTRFGTEILCLRMEQAQLMSMSRSPNVTAIAITMFWPGGGTRSGVGSASEVGVDISDKVWSLVTGWDSGYRL